MASIIVGGSALLFNETIVPLTDKAADNIMRYEVARQKPSLLKEQMFLREEKNGELSRVIYIGKLYPSEGNMNNVLIQEFEGGEIARIMTAKSGEWKEGEWWLHNGQVFSVKDDGLVEPLWFRKAATCSPCLRHKSLRVCKIRRKWASLNFTTI